MYITIFSLLATSDLLLTYIGLSTRSLTEGNPIGAYLYAEGGFIALVLAKALSMLVVVVGLTVLRDIKSRWLLYYYRFLAGVAFIPVVWNLWILST